MKLLAEGRGRAAVSTLRQAVAGGADDQRCLLASVLRIEGEPEEALSVLQDAEACGRQADWIRAEALLDLDRPEEAAALYAELGEASIGAERGRITAQRLVALTDRLLARPTPDGPQVTAALTLSLTLPLEPEDALPIARKLADVTAEYGGDGSAATGWLLAALNETDTRADRLRLARLLRSPVLLEALQEDAEILDLRLAMTDDLHRTLALTRALMADWPDDARTLSAQARVGEALAEAGWQAEAEELLAPLAEGFGAQAEAATWRLLQLHLQASNADAGLAGIDDFLKRFPRSAHRSTAEAARLPLLFDAARQSDALPAALAHYDTIISGWPGDPRAGQAALEAAHRVLPADAEEAWTRFEEILARWPGSEAAHTALQTRFALQAADDPEAARRWLQAQRLDTGGFTELVDSVELAVESPDDARPGRPITVDVLSRNLTDVEVSLHRIDPEAWLRDGGHPDTIEGLDVGIIAPDRRWQADVPDAAPYRRQRWSLSLPITEAGLYAVTVASQTRTATSILQVSDTDVLLQQVGKTLHIGVLRGERPAAGARVWVRGDEGVIAAKTDAAGLAEISGLSGELTVLASSPVGPAMAVLSAVTREGSAAAPVTHLDLDRPVYRPGDVLSYRIVSTHPVEGDWTVWLSGGSDRPHIRHTVTPVDGVLTGTLPVPLSDSVGTVRLMAHLPGEPEPQELGRAAVHPVTRVGRELTVAIVDDAAVVSVREEDGRPAVGVSVDWRWQEAQAASSRGTTDETGTLRLPAPMAGLPFTVEAVLAGTGSSAVARRGSSTASASASLRLPADRLLPGADVPVNITGRGAVEVVVFERLMHTDTAAPASVVPDITAGRLFAEAALPVDTGIRRVRSRTAVTLSGAQQLTLPALPAGEYGVVVYAEDGRTLVSDAGFSVREGARIGALQTALLGGNLTVPIHDGPALVTVLTGPKPITTLVTDGGVVLPVEADWAGAQVEMTAIDGQQHVRRVPVLLTPQVSLRAVEDDDGWRLVAEVRDAFGAPVEASVLLRASDPRLAAWAGQLATVPAGSMTVGSAPTVATMASRRFSHGVLSSLISPRILEDRALAEARERASRAVTGDLEDNAIRDLLLTGVPLSYGLGSRGSGLGGGGYASGIGGLGTRGIGSGRSGYGAAGEIREIVRPGLRGPLLWAVVQAGDDGRASAPLPDLDARTPLKLEAVAVVGSVVGRAQLTWSDPRPLLHLPELLAADAGQAQPEALLLAGDAPLSGTARIDGATVSLSIPAHGCAVIPLGAMRPGAERQLAVETNGLRRSAVVRWPRRTPTGEDGTVTVADPIDWLSTDRDPWSSALPDRAAAEARVLLAVWDALDEDRQRGLRHRLSALVTALPSGAGSYADTVGIADAIAAQAEAAEVPPGLVPVAATLSEGLDVTDTTIEERTALLHARLLAGIPVSDASLARLLRDPYAMDAEHQALLARALILLDRPAEARPLIQGEGPQAVLATRALSATTDSGALLRAAPPSHTARAAWAAAIPRGEPLRWAPTVVDPGEVGLAGRMPLSVSGRLFWRGSSTTSHCSPCRIQPGETLQVSGSLIGATVPGGLSAEGSTALRAVTPGRYRVTGVISGGAEKHLWVEVGDDPMPVSDGLALSLAEEALQTDADPTPWLAERALEDWPVRLRARVTTLRLALAVRDGDPRAAFEDLRELRPDERLSVETLAAVAGQYTADHPEQAIGIWRAAVGRMFLEEAAVVSRLSEVLGPLAAIQVLQEVALRFPHVPVVEQALFDLPDRLVTMASGQLPEEVRDAGVLDVDVQLMAAAWSREFVLLHPESELAPQAGLRLAVGLLALDAPERAADWAERMHTAWPEHALTDRLLLVEGIARAASDQPGTARDRLSAVARADFPRSDGTRGASEVADEARLALARLDESTGAFRRAASRYREVDGTFAEADASLSVLDRSELSVASAVTLSMSEPLRIPLQVAGIDEVTLRAYALDLRTLFLRDGGLSGIPGLQIAGVAPAWQGRQRLSGRPFSESTSVRLPLSGPGAWLVQLEGGGQQVSTLVVRSDLTVEAVDSGDVRRLTVLRRGRAAPDVEVRALSDQLIAETTDPRGVVILPAFAPALVYDGDHVAFTPASTSQRASGSQGDELSERLAAEVDRLRGQTRTEFAFIGERQEAGVVISGL